MKQGLFIRRMIVRELRRERQTLFAALLPIVVGVSVIVSLGTLRVAALGALNSQSREVAGADISLSMRGKPSAEYLALQAEIPGDRVVEVSFPSMIQAGDASRLVQVQGLSAAFPFYGVPTTDPPNRAAAYLDGRSVVLEQALALQLGVSVGDLVRLGDKDFTVAALMLDSYGETELRMTIAPRVFALDQALKAAGLLEHGIRQQTVTHYRLAENENPDKLLKRFEKQADGIGARLATPKSKQEALGSTVGRVYQFLQLVALATLITGALGAVSGGAHFAAKKQRDVALFRCVGASLPTLLIVYTATFFVAALFFSLLGALIAIPLLRLLGNSISIFLPVTLPEVIMPSPLYVLLGMCLGTLAPLSFAITPILKLKGITPLVALRTQVEDSGSQRGRAVGVLVTLSALIIGGGSLLGEQSTLLLALSGALLVLVVFLSGFAWCVRMGINVIRRSGVGSFGLRHGLASIGRPGNEALFISILVGLPLFLGLSLWTAGNTLTDEVERLLSESSENLVLFDVQPDQRSIVEEVSKAYGVRIVRWYPLVSMRISEVKGVPVTTLLENAKTSRDRWQLSRQYRNTYRSELVEHEQLLSGQLIPSVPPGTEVIPVSIEQRMAERLGVGLDDTIVFNVQGLQLTTMVKSIRRFDFRGVNPGFFVVFPKGVLEGAPHFNVATGMLGDANALPAFQKALLEQASNVSIIDTSTIRSTIRKIFVQLGTTVQLFVWLFLIAASTVIVTTVYLSSGSRLRDFRIYSYLGARRATLGAMAFTEFYAIGVLGSGAGAVATIVFSILIAHYYFKISASLSLLTIVGIPLILSLGVAILGLAGFLLAFRSRV